MFRSVVSSEYELLAFSVDESDIDNLTFTESIKKSYSNLM